MRRSVLVTLTLVPALAASAVARADAPTVPEAALPFDPQPTTVNQTFAPPGMSEQVLMPPGMTPPIDCDEDNDADLRPECQPQEGFYRWNGVIVRGGFGHYFWVGGG
ncbi:MAG TPA: hypothetical protein VGG28_04710 [Kofleriaceae bacterium]|jgi:hypothetical protein